MCITPPPARLLSSLSFHFPGFTIRGLDEAMSALSIPVCFGSEGCLPVDTLTKELKASPALMECVCNVFPRGPLSLFLCLGLILIPTFARSTCWPHEQDPHSSASPPSGGAWAVTTDPTFSWGQLYLNPDPRSPRVTNVNTSHWGRKKTFLPRKLLFHLLNTGSKSLLCTPSI